MRGMEIVLDGWLGRMEGIVCNKSGWTVASTVSIVVAADAGKAVFAVVVAVPINNPPAFRSACRRSNSDRP